MKECAMMPAPLLLSKRLCRCSAILAVSIVIPKEIFLDKEMIAIDTQCKSCLLYTSQLADKKCVPCRGGVPPLKGKELEKLQQSVPKWMVYDEHQLHCEFKFPDFKQALEFVNRVGALAEEQGHHPDILLAWGKAEITLWTHKICLLYTSRCV